MDKKLWIPFILTLLATLFMLSCIFIPYATATPEQAEKLALFPDAQIDDSLSLTAKDMQDISMVKYAYMYSAIKDQSAANARDLGRVQRKILLFGHFNGNLTEIGKKQRTTERSSAHSHSAHQFGLVANTDLS